MHTLHSTVVLLKVVEQAIKEYLEKTLHSTVVLLKAYQSSIIMFHPDELYILL